MAKRTHFAREATIGPIGAREVVARAVCGAKRFAAHTFEPGRVTCSACKLTPRFRRARVSAVTGAAEGGPRG